MVFAEINDRVLRVESDCGKAWNAGRSGSLPTTSIKMVEGKRYKVIKVIYKVMVKFEDNTKFHPLLDITNNPKGQCKEYHLILEEL